MPAHGRRVRRQGDAAARVRGGRRPGGAADRPPGSAAAEPCPGLHDDRQAPRVPRAVAGGVRRRRPAAGPRRDPHLRRRLEPRPLRAGAGPGPVPRRQRLLDPRRAGERPHRAHEQDVADGVPRLRGSAGDARHRGRAGAVRAAARPRPGRPAPPQLLRRGAAHPLRPAGAPPRPDGHLLGAAARLGRRGGAAGRDRRLERPARARQAGPGAHPRQVRHLVQLHRVQPGRRAGARLQGRLGARDPRRHRDGPGAAHQDAPGRRHRAGGAAADRAARADPHRQGAQHLRDGRQLGRRPQRRRGQGRLRAGARPPAPGRGRAPRRRPGRRAVPRRGRHRPRQRRVARVGRPRQGGLLPAGAALGRRLLPHRGPALGLGDDAGRPLQVLLLRRRGDRGRGRRVHRRLPHAPGRHRPRRRRQPLPARRPRAGRGGVRAGRRLADPGGPAVGRGRRPGPRRPGHPRGQHLQAAELLRDARGLPRRAARPRPRGRRGLRLQGRRRAAADARLLGARGPAPGRGGVRATRARASTSRRRPPPRRSGGRWRRRAGIRARGDRRRASSATSPTSPTTTTVRCARAPSARPAPRAGSDVHWLDAVQRLRRDRRPGVLVTLAAVRGHAPRAAGAKMVVTADAAWDSIGGGNLEATAVARARELLAGGVTAPEQLTVSLDRPGPHRARSPVLRR